MSEIYTCGDLSHANNVSELIIKSSQDSITTSSGIILSPGTKKHSSRRINNMIPDVLAFGHEVEATISHCRSNIISVAELSENEGERIYAQSRTNHFEDTGLSQMLIVPDLSVDLNLANATSVTMDSHVPETINDPPGLAMLESFSPMGFLKNITSLVGSVDTAGEDSENLNSPTMDNKKIDTSGKSPPPSPRKPSKVASKSTNNRSKSGQRGKSDSRKKSDARSKSNTRSKLKGNKKKGKSKKLSPVRKHTRSPDKRNTFVE